MNKSIFKSWTFWFGTTQILLGGIGLLSGLMQSSEALTLVMTGLGTIGFRVKTTVGVKI